MMGRAERITKAVRSYDPELYCDKNREGKLCVFRKGSRIESYDVDGHQVDFVRPSPYFVFALTDNWRTHGVPVEWGIMPIMARLKAVDLWKRDMAEESIQSVEAANLSRERDRNNSIESFLYDFRSQFARATNDVNTASLEKKDRKRKETKWQL